MDDTVHIPYIVDRLDKIIDLYEEDVVHSLSAVEELRRELIFNMGVNSLARHKDQDHMPPDEWAAAGGLKAFCKLRGVPNDD